MLVSEEEFYVLYKGKNSTYSEYKAAVKRTLKRFITDKEDIHDIILRPNVEAVLNSNYEAFLIGIDGCSLRETAECLGLDFE